jgi:hypothetical protein
VQPATSAINGLARSRQYNEKDDEPWRSVMGLLCLTDNPNTIFSLYSLSVGNFFPYFAPEAMENRVLSHVWDTVGLLSG